MITKINKNLDTLDLVSEVHRAYKFLDKLPNKEGRHAVCGYMLQPFPEDMKLYNGYRGRFRKYVKDRYIPIPSTAVSDLCEYESHGRFYMTKDNYNRYFLKQFPELRIQKDFK
jgi:hypothetical protein